MLVPEEIVVDIGDETFVQRRLVGRGVVFVPEELELNFAQVGFGDTNRAQEGPGYPEHVVSVELFLAVSVEECLVVEVEDFEEENGVGVEQQMCGVVYVEFFIGVGVLWFHMPLELPSFLKSQQAVAKGRMISFSVDSYFFSMRL